VQAWRETYPGIVQDDVLAALQPEERAMMWQARLNDGGRVVLTDDSTGIAGFADGGAQRDASLPFTGEVMATCVLRRAADGRDGTTVAGCRAPHDEPVGGGG